MTELARRGHELVVCARRAELSQDPPFELIVTGPASRFESVEPLAYMRQARRIFARLDRERPFDLAHWIFPSSAELLLFSPPRALPFVVGPQGAPWPPGVWSRPRRAGDVVRGALRPLFARAHARTLAAGSLFLGGTPEAAESFPAERFRVVPFGVDVVRFPPQPLPASRRILFVGRVEPNKGVRELVEAFPRVRERVPDAALTVAGAGPLVDWARRRAVELDVADAVSVLGHVEQAQLPDLLRDCALLCLPSYADAYGMVLLEAMATQRAVVASDVIGPRFLLDGGRFGRLVPPGDAAALAAALADLLAQPSELERLGLDGRRRVEERFTVARSADGVEQAYADVLEAA
ncbi:MAG TPA: glycosyltransferase family 4 protein [Gaiellaceae bacterium]|nr:glycosyltransferase family 4 protein [Gaiellaceae bacterium]